MKTTKSKKQKQEAILRKLTKQWLEDNKEMMEDYQELCHKLFMFRAMWGIEVGFIFKNPQEIEGRELGVGFVEELFSKQ